MSVLAPNFACWQESLAHVDLGYWLSISAANLLPSKLYLAYTIKVEYK